MIQVMRNLFLFYVLFSLSTSVLGQEDFYSNFNAASINGKVALHWTINQGNTCTGTYIQRSSDSVQFEEIGVIEGICGNPESPTPYSYNDPDPLPNQMNYYRLRFGASLVSEILPVDVRVYGENGFLLSEHPVRSTSILSFENPPGSVAELRIVSMDGQFCSLLNTHTDTFTIHAEDFDQGVYFFILQRESGHSLTGRIVFY